MRPIDVFRDKKMKKIAIVLGFVMAFVGIVQAQEKDPLDVSSELERIEKYGVPTVEVVENLKINADSLYNAKDWQNAIEALENHATNANWLANLLSQCVEPYYSASYDDKKNISYFSLKPYIPFENKANALKRERNVSYVKIGICYKNLGNNKKAIAYLYKGLDLLSVEQTEYWIIAKNAIAEIVGFTPEN